MDIQLLERFQYQPLAMSREAAGNLKYIANAKINRQADDFLSLLMSEMGVDNVSLLTFGERKPYPVLEGGIAIISVKGTLYSNENYWGNYYTGYESIEMRFARAMADRDVRGVVLDINSHGGEAAGCFECGDILYRGRSDKPIWAHVKHHAYSGGYAIASAADKIYGTPSAGLGSIGVLVAHFDMSKLLDDVGIKVTLISAGKHKTDGNPYEPLPKAVREKIQTRVEQTNDAFVAYVARNRGLDEQAIRDLEADVFQIDQAVDLGLADGKKTSQEFYADFLNFISNPTFKGGPLAMTDNANTPGAAPDTTGAESPAAQNQPQANAKTEAELKQEMQQVERQRIGAILGCDEAKGKQKLANHLATATNLSVEEAKQVLASAAPEKVEGKPPENPFLAAMDQEENPDVGTGDDQDLNNQAPDMWTLFDKAHPDRVRKH